MLLLLVKLLLPLVHASGPTHVHFMIPPSVEQLEGAYVVVDCPATTASELEIKVDGDLVSLVDQDGSTVFWFKGLERADNSTLKQVISDPKQGMVFTNSMHMSFGNLKITTQREQPFSLGRGRHVSTCDLKQKI